MQPSYLDEAGYPTSTALAVIEFWPYKDPKGWFEFIEPLWQLGDWGWRIKYLPTFDDGEHIVYELRTAGWSGNEQIIRAMEKNELLWQHHWLESRRGGYHQFEVKEYEPTNS